MKDDEPTIQDVLNAVNATSTAIEGRFNTLETKTGSLETKMVTREELGQALNKQKLDILDAMDDKLGDLKWDLVVIMRKEDKKVTALIGLLTERRIISMDDAKQLLGMEPFPQISL